MSLKEQIQASANAMREAGAAIEIDEDIPTVSIVLSNGDDYFFQENEASALLEEFKDRAEINEVCVEDVILYSACSW